MQYRGMTLKDRIKVLVVKTISCFYSNVSALCPAKIVQTGFVDRDEAESMLALKKN